MAEALRADQPGSRSGGDECGRAVVVNEPILHSVDRQQCGVSQARVVAGVNELIEAEAGLSAYLDVEVAAGT